MYSVHALHVANINAKWLYCICQLLLYDANAELISLFSLRV